MFLRPSFAASYEEVNEFLGKGQYKKLYQVKQKISLASSVTVCSSWYLWPVWSPVKILQFLVWFKLYLMYHNLSSIVHTSFHQKMAHFPTYFRTPNSRSTFDQTSKFLSGYFSPTAQKNLTSARATRTKRRRWWPKPCCVSCRCG